MVQAIVYTSNTGYTAEYARMLGEKTGLPVYALDKAIGTVEGGTEILYLGWLMAGKIKGYAKAAKCYRIRCACAVGTLPSGTRLAELREGNRLPKGVQLFTLQGGFDLNRLHGGYKLMMKLMVSTVFRSQQEKKNKTPEEETMLNLITKGGNLVSEENLTPVLDWYREQA